MGKQPIPYEHNLLILGHPIETDLGIVKQPKVCEYLQIQEYSYALQFDRKKILGLLNKIKKEEPTAELWIELWKELSALEFLRLFNSYDLRDTVFAHIYVDLQKMFKFFFNNDVLHHIETDTELEFYLDIFRTISGIEKDFYVPNEFIMKQERIKKQLELEKTGGGISIEDVITTVEVATGLDVSNMTLYKLHKLFERVNKFKEHDMTKLYSMISSDIKPVMWFEKPQEAERKLKSISEDDMIAKK